MGGRSLGVAQGYVVYGLQPIQDIVQRSLLTDLCNEGFFVGTVVEVVKPHSLRIAGLGIFNKIHYVTRLSRSERRHWISRNRASVRLLSLHHNEQIGVEDDNPRVVPKG